MLKKLFGVWLVCAACITAVPVCAAETGFAVTVGAEKESTATFEKDKTFSGTAENGDVVTISVYTENYRGNRVLRSSTEIEVGASGLFSQSVGLRLGENLKQNRIHAEAKRQKVQFFPFPGEALITADRDRVAQVFTNIFTNAVKYSLEEASITIRIEEDPMYFKLSVADTGLGIRREDLSRIFERFYRVDKARSRAMGGTGLGLAIVKEIMDLHGGKILVESQYGKGTTMTLCFLKTPFRPNEPEEDEPEA